MKIFIMKRACKLTNTQVDGLKHVRFLQSSTKKYKRMKRMKHLSFFFLFIFIACSHSNQPKNTVMFIDKNTIQSTVSAIVKHTSFDEKIIEKGVTQVAGLWREEDGSKEEFSSFCQEHFCKNAPEKEQLFQRVAMHFETIYGHHNRMSIELLRPQHVVGYEKLTIDDFFGAYNGFSHFQEDMCQNKIAFIVALNFPFYTLEEKTKEADKWTSLEWGYARLGDVFTANVPAKILQNIQVAGAASDNYISNYNIFMGSLINNRQQHLFPKDMVLISHWGLRDELKSNYADKKQGLEKQKMIYEVMKHIIYQTVPNEVINTGKFVWNPLDNKIYEDGSEVKMTAENNRRYRYLMDNFKAMQKADPYYTHYPTYIARKFEGEFEIAQKEIEQLFIQLLSSPQVKEVGNLISQRLGRKLQAFDIWYDGFKSRSEINPLELDKAVMKKYPTKEAFTADLPQILLKLGFEKEKAQFICNHIDVDASVGAGHAWGSMMRLDKAMLRTRIGEKGMDYKGYNIGVHEFGHNVEQTISLHDVPNYFLAGVPNTAFTEALAFVFQQRDLELLGIRQADKNAEYLNTLDVFWGCYEIMGVSLLDMKVWQWMYAHPDATADELKTEVIKMAKEIWNTYYAPVFGTKDEPILAIYSHMIDAPLYLSAYPLGHLIQFQLEEYLKGKNIGTEVQRIFAMGKLTPQIWMQKAVGNPLSVEPLLKATAEAVEKTK